MLHVALLGELGQTKCNPWKKTGKVEEERRRGVHVSVCLVVLHLFYSVFKSLIISFCCLAINSVIP